MINFFSVSEKGLRENNEDNVIILNSDTHLLALVCDGMGGHEAGEEASFLVIESFKKLFENEKPKFDDNEINIWYKKGIENAKLEMNNKAKKEPKKIDMGTTMVSILIFKKEKKIVFANVGDSRAYAYNDLLHQITEDQNLLNFYINEKHLTFEEANFLPDAHHLISSIGPTKKYEMQFSFIEWEKELKYLILTSDGVHDFLNKPKLEAILFSKNGIEKKAFKMIESALKSGSNDNLTIAILELNYEIK